MNKILAFGGSTSKNSINKKFASFVVNKIAPKEAILIDLNDYEMPIYSEDREREEGVPKKAFELKKLIKEVDGIIISLAEHNGAYTAAFKNIYDWISVIETVVWDHKPIFLLSTAAGPRGGKNVLDIALSRFSRQSLFKIPHFSLPSFNENFSINKGVLDNALNAKLEEQIAIFKSQLSESQ